MVSNSVVHLHLDQILCLSLCRAVPEVIWECPKLLRFRFENLAVSSAVCPWRGPWLDLFVFLLLGVLAKISMMKVGLPT
jgi:hypothetical protein